MKRNLVIALGFIVLFGFMNQSFMPVPVRITAYSLALMPSVMASGLTYWYYDSTMEAKHTVLTTAAKSVIAWHSIVIITYYGQLTAALIWSTELEEYWKNHGNQTCVTISAVSFGPTFMISLIEFQVIRAIFVFYPYDVLNLNHEILAYPLVASVPMISGTILLIIYFIKGGICNEYILKNIIEELDISIDFENFIFSNAVLAPFFLTVILVLEVCIRLKNNWKDLTETVMHPVCCCKKTNAVNPSTSQASSETQQLASFLNQYKVGPFMLEIICFVFLQVLLLILNYSSILIAINKVFLHSANLGLPIFYVISTDEIFDFVNLKYNQLKYRLGYFKS